MALKKGFSFLQQFEDLVRDFSQRHVRSGAVRLNKWCIHPGGFSRARIRRVADVYEQETLLGLNAFRETGFRLWNSNAIH